MFEQILYCAQNIALYDKDPEPRRAAVFLISNILTGLGTHMFKVCLKMFLYIYNFYPGAKFLFLKVLEPVLPDLYKNLRTISSTDEDEATRIHAGTSLNALNKNTKEFFNVKPKLEKNIRVLDPFQRK